MKFRRRRAYWWWKQDAGLENYFSEQIGKCEGWCKHGICNHIWNSRAVLQVKELGIFIVVIDDLKHVRFFGLHWDSASQVTILVVSVPPPGVAIGKLGSFSIVSFAFLKLSESDVEVILPLGCGEGSNLCIFRVIFKGYFKFAWFFGWNFDLKWMRCLYKFVCIGGICYFNASISDFSFRDF